MSDTVIDVEKLGKKYVIHHQKDARSVMVREAISSGAQRLMMRVFGNRPTNGTREEFWALRDVSFKIKQGEIVGIVGRNGAGKSTLLKILSRIIEPTVGRAKIKGRVASLLEVGTGFNAELTGRENIFLNGAILGMRQAEIRRKFDEIVSFAEVEKFLDTPVKHYSSGMYLRLAFAVAAHLDPEILLVDEVLAVGDADFQKKCLGKMDKVAQQGRTVIFVSHNMAVIKRLCTTGLYLLRGQLVQIGDPTAVITKYLHEEVHTSANLELSEHVHLVKSPVQISRIAILNGSGILCGVMRLDEDVQIQLAVRVTETISNVRIGVGLYADGVRIATSHTAPIDFIASEDLRTYTCRIPGNSLLPNVYSLHIGAHSAATGKGLDWVVDAANFEIESIGSDTNNDHDRKEIGLVRLPLSWEGPSLHNAQ